MQFDNNGDNNGTLRFIGATARPFHVAVTMTLSPASANDVFVLGICKNGSTTALPNGKVKQKLVTATDQIAFSYHVAVMLSPNDYVNACIGNITDTDDADIITMNIFAME